MKQTSLIFYFGILIASLIFAYFTWTGETKKADDKVSILSCKKGDLLGLTLKTPKRSVSFFSKISSRSGKPYWWVEITRPRLSSSGENSSEDDEAPTKVFKGNLKLHETLEKFCPWKCLRALGSLGEEKRELFGLTDSEERLSLSLTSGLRQFRIGQAISGMRDRYLEDEKTGEIYLVAGQGLKDLLFPKSRFMERTLHDFKPAEVTRIGLKADRDLDLIHLISQEGKDEGWADSRTPETPKDIYQNWIRKILALGITGYFSSSTGVSGQSAGCTPPPDTETRLHATFFSKKKEIGFLTIFKGDEEKKSDYYACTEHTEGIIVLPKSQAETLLKDLQDILPGF